MVLDKTGRLTCCYTVDLTAEISPFWDDNIKILVSHRLIYSKGMQFNCMPWLAPVAH